jgi:UDP-N-acetylmuramoyl-tripeptide--D-alanyl-D-alanine ligase
MDKGARGFFYQPEHLSALPAQHALCGIAVDDTLKTLQLIANCWRKSMKQLTVFSLTGSVGKTTCKEFLAQILSGIAPTHYSRGNLNNEVGLPLSLLQLTSSHRFSVIEMGARHPGDIAALVKIAEPDFVAVLNVVGVHLEIFGSLAEVRKTKLEIISTGSRRKACVLADQGDLLADALKICKDLVTFGYAETATIRVQEVTSLPLGGMEIQLSYGGVPLAFSLPVAHQSYPINLAAACALTYAAGIPAEKIRGSLQDFRGLPGRFLIHKHNDLTLVDDTYNASPLSMEAGLKSLGTSFPTQKKILVLGSMFELGDEAAQQHFRIGRFSQETLAPALLVTVGELGREIGRGALAAGLAPACYQHFENCAALIAAELPFARWGKVLYAKASRGMQLDKLITHLIKPS